MFGGHDDLDTEDDAEKSDIPIHAFDLVDRRRMPPRLHGGRQLWRNMLDHFDAVTIGLTATPAAHTWLTFNEVVFRYDTEQAPCRMAIWSTTTRSRSAPMSG